MKRKTYSVVAWPEIKKIAGLEGFEENAYAIAGFKGALKFGDGAHFVDNEWLERVSDGDVYAVGKGAFGYIFDAFRGKAREAVKFLVKHRDGDLLEVFRRDGLGGVDLVWGNEWCGLLHIITKHLDVVADKSEAEALADRLETIITSGKIEFEDGDKAVLSDGEYLVTVRKNYRTNGKKIADKNWVLTAYEKKGS
jgi:hypothetical protein